MFAFLGRALSLNLMRLGLAIATTLLFWASAFAAIGVALEGYTPGQIGFSRFFVASVLMAGFALAGKIRRPDRADLPRIIVVALLGIPAYNLLLNYGKQTVTAGSASFIVNIGPVFAALFSTWLLRERVRPWAWAGMAVSLAGVGIIAFGEHGLSLGLGTVLLLGAAVAQSLYFVVQKPLLARYSAKEIVAYSFWLGPAVLAFTAGGLPDAGAHAPARATGVLLYLGVFPSFLGFICWSYVLARLPASHAASLLYLIPAVTIGIAYFWLHELPRPVALSGGGLCLLGVVVVNTLGRPAAKA